MDLNLCLYLALFLLLVGLFLFSFFKRRQEEAREKDAHSQPGTEPLNPEEADRGPGE